MKLLLHSLKASLALHDEAANSPWKEEFELHKVKLFQYPSKRLQNFK